MDVIDLLTADHNRMKGLFAQFEQAKEAEDSATMQMVVAKIVEDLKAHEKAEEQCFYPEVKQDSEEIKDQVLEGYEEHHVADRLVEELGACAPEDERYPAKVKVLIESLEHHMEEEESGLFVNVRKERAAADLEQMCEEIVRLKQQLGSPIPAQAEGLSKQQLSSLAAEQQIPGRSRMTTDELAATVDARNVS